MDSIPAFASTPTCSPSDDDDYPCTLNELGSKPLVDEDCEHVKQFLIRVRSLITDERSEMQADYLEAQIKLFGNDFKNSIHFAKIGLGRAQTLEAKEYEARFTQVLYDIDTKLKIFT